MTAAVLPGDYGESVNARTVRYLDESVERNAILVATRVLRAAAVGTREPQMGRKYIRADCALLAPAASENYRSTIDTI